MSKTTTNQNETETETEEMLQEDQDKFEEFLKRNDKMAHQAIAKAEKVPAGLDQVSAN